MDSITIAALPGDGIGIDVTHSALKVLEALGSKIDMRFVPQHHRVGAIAYQETGTALSDKTIRAAGEADAMLLGAMGLPHIRYDDGTEISPQLDLREHFGLFAGVRPIRPLTGVPSKLADPRAASIDFVMVREQTEGLFKERGATAMKSDEEARDAMVITRAGVQRVSDFALELGRQRKARGRPGRVTCVDKANVLGSMAYFRRVFEERAAAFPDVIVDAAYVDAMALNLVMKPWDYDVMVTENLLGDILSDLGAALVGGMGMAPSADIGESHALFQPAHGSAPDIAGRGIANPTAMLLSVVLMLDWLASHRSDQRLGDAARALERAIDLAYAEKRIMPFEFGGSSGTADITREVIAGL